MYISKVAQEYCLLEKYQEPLERAEEAGRRLALWQFKWEEVGKWNRVGIVSSFEAVALCRNHFCFPSSDFWGNEEL